jgi:hypothetical protein
MVEYVPHSVLANEVMYPTVTQIQILNSQFKDVKTWIDGSFALLDIDQIKMSIMDSTFTNI